MNFKQGIRDGIPIGLGYAAVSFAFGILAVDKDLTVSEAVLISLTNLTSAGQFAGLTIIAELGTLVEMALSQFIINLRYMLMAISLSQKVDDDFKGIWRWILGFAITDEIFAVAIQNPGKIKRNYFMGLTIIPIIGWTLGTLGGALLGNILPAIITKPIKMIIPITNVITAFFETFFSEKEIFLVFILWPFLSLTFHLLIFFFLFILCLPFVINKSDNAIDDPANQTTNRIHHQIIYVKHTNLCDKL